MEISLLDLSENLRSIIALEGKISAYEGVQENTKGPDISLLAVGTLEDLRCHVVRSSRHGCQLTVISRSFGQTKVDKAHCVVSCNHDVIWFYISMNNVLSMAMVDSLEQTAHVTCSLRLRKGLILLLSDLIEELGARHVLHHQVDVLLIVVRFVVLDDIGMIE